MKTARETAERYGKEFAEQVAADTTNHQDGPGTMGDNDDMPDGDYVALKREFGEVTEEMVEAYRDGYNSVS